MAIDQNTLARVAALARIRVTEESAPLLLAEFNQVLDFVSRMDSADVEGVEPMTAPEVQRLAMRADEVTEGDSQAAVLAHAPDAREGFFAVPKMVE